MVIIGGGFSGINCLLNANNKNYEFTLIDKNQSPFISTLLYQVATAVLSPADIAVPIRDIFRGKKIFK